MNDTPRDCIQLGEAGTLRSRALALKGGAIREPMRIAILRSFCVSLAVAVLLVGVVAGQDTGPVQGNAVQASQPGGVTGGPGNSVSGSSVVDAAAGTHNGPAKATASTPAASENSKGSASPPSASNTDDNPYNPYLEPPPLPKGKTTLIGGVATSVDKVRNRLTVQPFGKGTKVKLILDERSKIYRDGTETTVLGIRKGDRVYVDTMLDGSKVFARNVRVVTESGPAEVRGQIISANLGDGKISVKDELSSHPVTFAVNNATKYTAARGDAASSDLRPGSLIEVQFSTNESNRDIAQEITVLAKPGDNYVFSGTVTSIDMRSGTLALDNRSDDQNYEIQIAQATMTTNQNLRVGSEITARTVFDGKVYKASDVTIDEPPAGAKDENESEVK